jgi:electron-transferring-flavoprotein dehydrogenase
MGDDAQRLDVDVLFVGAGPANLAGALRLCQLVSQHNARVSTGRLPGTPLAPLVAVIEKGRDAGAHAISGALVDPIALAELLPDYAARGFPLSVRVVQHGFYYLTSQHEIHLPDFLIPASYRSNHCYVGSLQRINLWLSELLQGEGVNLFGEACGAEVLFDEKGHVCGVKTGAKGLGADGSRKTNYEPGVEIRAKVTVFGEGPHGTLAEDVIQQFNLREGRQPQRYALGVKELIRVKGEGSPGLAIHTLGYPLGSRVFGGGFCYGYEDGVYAVGLVCGLDWEDPRMDVQGELQRLKKHPLIQRFIKGGEVFSYGAKALPEGGYFALPRPYVNGALIVGDSAGFVNVPYLKGIHYAMKSGMLAAETIVEALGGGDTSAAALSLYETRLASSYVMQDLYRVRHFRRAFRHGLFPGLLFGGLAMRTGLGPAKSSHPDEDFMSLRPPRQPLRSRQVTEPTAFDARVIVDKLTDVLYSGTRHREDQPSHIRIVDPARCVTDCIPRFGEAPCTHFCPANVYELVTEGPERRIQINFANCLHCKTCVIKDPIDVIPGDHVQNIVWRAPAEGGPHYQGL